MSGRRSQIVEDARRADDRCLLGMSQRNLDHLDPEQRRIWILVERRSRAAGQLAGRANAGGARDVHVDVIRILRIHEQRVGVRSAARLDVADILRVRNVADVEDAKSAQAILADGVLHTLGAAIDASAVPFAGHEKEILVYRDVALRGRAEVPRLQSGMTSI